MGDGGSGGDPHGNGQNRDALLGKLLRIDVDVPSRTASRRTTPSSASQARARDLGPGRRATRGASPSTAQTGDLFIGDVGQNAWEEIDAEKAGAGGRNYGWNVMEATHCFRRQLRPGGPRAPGRRVRPSTAAAR